MPGSPPQMMILYLCFVLRTTNLTNKMTRQSPLTDGAGAWLASIRLFEIYDFNWGPDLGGASSRSRLTDEGMIDTS